MKRNTKTYMRPAVMLCIALLVCALPATAASAATTPQLTPGTATASPGQTVQIPVTLSNNSTGFALLSFTVNWDSQALTMVSYTPGILSGLTGNTSTGSFLWASSSSCTTNGTVVTLSFKVNAGTAPGDYTVSVTGVSAAKLDETPVTVNGKSGKITVRAFMRGDVNDDGKINPLDLVLLRRFLAGGYGVVINELAADVNDSGRVDPIDVVLLARYLAGGYGVVIPAAEKEAAA